MQYATTFQPMAPAGSNWDRKSIQQLPEFKCEVCGVPVSLTLKSLSLPARILCAVCREINSDL
jgi:hypothetical protein